MENESSWSTDFTPATGASGLDLKGFILYFGLLDNPSEFFMSQRSPQDFWILATALFFFGFILSQFHFVSRYQHWF